jgi:hypothetical protein
MKKINKLIFLFFFLPATLAGVFAKEASAQVNLQTGSAVFSLPLFNWQDNESRLKTILALDYNSGNGLKVDETASDEGQGWNLIAGGVITRLQVGEPDDQKAYYKGIQSGAKEQDGDVTKYPAGYLYAPVAATMGCPQALTKYPLYKAINQIYAQHNTIAEDRELDYFSFQFNGKAGMFVLDPATGTGMPLGDTKMKITFVTDTTMATGDSNGIRTTITSFSIQDVNGLIYTFGTNGAHGLSRVLQQQFCDPNATRPKTQPTFKDSHIYYQSGFENSRYVNPWVIDSWYLTQIRDPLTGRTVQFSYTPHTITNNNDIGIMYNEGDNSHVKSYVILTRRTSITVARDISGISYPDGHAVIFHYGAGERADLPGEYPLASVDITYEGRFLSEYDLKTSYFILKRYGTPVSTYERSVARLCLRSVTKVGVDLKASSPPYLFDYYMGNADSADDFVPPPFFYAKDIWGYFNGNASVSWDGSAIPLNDSILQLNFNQLRGLCFYHENDTGVVLNPKAGYAENGLLRQVIYPTGGALTYTYSQNTGALAAGGADQMVGGVHVSETSSSDGGYQHGCSNPVVTHYDYVLGAPGSASSLWGLEKPANIIHQNVYYAPEWRSFNPLTLSCYWHFHYPGILSQYQSVNVSGWQSAMNTLSPYLGAASEIGDVMDVVMLVGYGTGLGWVITDGAAIVLNVTLSCVGSNAMNFPSTIYFNTNLNDVSPLPQQFKRVVITGGGGGVGKSVQTFTSDDDYPVWIPAGDNPTFSSEQRFAPWAYGMPKLTKVYDSTGHLVRETQNIYSTANAKELVDEGSPKYFCFDHPDVCEQTGLQTLLVSCKCQVLQINSQRSTYWSTPSEKSGDGGYDDSASYYNNTNPSPSGLMNVDFYGMYSGRVELDTTYQRTYRENDSTQYIQTETDYSYNSGADYYDGTTFWPNNYEVNEIVTHQSNGDVYHKYFKYSTDYYDSTSILHTLVQNNLVSVPVETSTSVMKAGADTQEYLGEHVTEYTQLADGNIVASDVLEQRLSAPSSTMPLYGGPGSNISNYHVVRQYTYDGSGDVIGEQDEGMHVISNIYGYNNKYIIATVINANPLTDKPAYTSFEDASLGGWTLSGTANYVTGTAITGTRSLALSSGNTLTAPLNTTKAYTLSFWATGSVSVTGGATEIKSGPAINGFTYNEYSIIQGTSSVSVTGSGDIDELRLYPQDARMSTVTYDPLIGKTSTCDESSRLAYYTYDSVGRLQFIKDESGNIVKAYEYNNVSPMKQNGCPGTYYNREISELFTRSNCSVGSVGDTTPYVYTVPAGKDTSTISQADADVQAQTDILTNGQALANANSSCIPIYYNTAQSVTDSTQSCAEGYVGGYVTYTVPANTYSSYVSAADADSQAMEEVQANAQAYANDSLSRSCIYSTAPDWEWAEADSSDTYCSSVNGEGHLFVLMTDMNPNSSTYNQTQYMDMGPQSECPACMPVFTYSSAISSTQMNDISISDTMVSFTWVFTFPNEGYEFRLGAIAGSCCYPTSTRTIPYIESGTTFNLIINTDGTVDVQVVSGPIPPAGSTVGFSGSYDINMNAYYSAAESGTFCRNNCPSGETGSCVTYTIPAYQYHSYVSQQDANNQADSALAAGGQDYANANGTCNVPCGFTPASGMTFYTNTVSESGSTASFDFVFPMPNSSYTGGTIGTITGGCVPSTVQSITVTDNSGYGDQWFVQIYPSGVVDISLESGTPPSGSPVQLEGTYGL